MNDAWEELCLLADKGTVRAGRRMRMVAKQLEKMVRVNPGMELDQEAWSEKALVLRHARDACGCQGVDACTSPADDLPDRPR